MQRSDPHHDHVTPAAGGGVTTAANGQGLCEACNYTKEAPGRQVQARSENGCHTTDNTVPTGAVHSSNAPPLPGPIANGVHDIDFVRFRVAVRKRAA